MQLSILIRSPSNVPLVANLLSVLTGATAVRQTKNSSTVVTAGNSIFHLYSDKSISSYAFRDKADRIPSSLCLTSVRLCASLDEAEHSPIPPPPSPPGFASRFFGGSSVLAPRIEASRIDPGDVEEGGSAPPRGMPPAGHLKEVVLGAEGESYDTAAQTLEHARGARRNRVTPALWTFPPLEAAIQQQQQQQQQSAFGTSSSSSTSTNTAAAALRLIPSRYSALIFSSLPNALPSPRHSPPGSVDSVMDHLFQEQTRLTKLLHSAIDSADVAASQCVVYGSRKGTEAGSDCGGAQLVIYSPLLSGLGLRFCVSPSYSAFHNEAPEAFDDAIDPTMNPDASADIKRKPLACNSVIGMEVVSAIKMRVRNSLA